MNDYTLGIDSYDIGDVIIANRITRCQCAFAPDRSATVYLNEIKFIASVRSKSTLAAGDPVRNDDIADIVRINPEGVIVHEGAAAVVLLSAGWRKAIYF